MDKLLKMSAEDIINHLKLSFQVPSILEAIATQRIIAHTAAEVGIELSVEELQQAADSMRLANRLLKADDTWNWLQKHYLTIDDFEEVAKTNLLYMKLAEYLFAEKVEPYFYAHKIDYTGAVTYEVILDDEDLALELFYALQEGEISFQEIARQYIQYPEIRRAGGYQGTRYRQDFRPEIAAAVFAATPPQILKPIITPQGVHIIVVEEIITPELDESRRIQILKDFFTNWLQQQITNLELVADLSQNGYSPSSSELPKPA
ncbi:peptidylprolyl isomerase [Anabaena subtropica]|uniref:peptidylprolyl isomerase n=1 Tax=Anabaena subtropica FACHB-260 TaxID=2692884 RepID=A0ABR8CS83_9NOST|nr:peptidylprolyl isomerase [Anabaena subtropica]MBD2345894.1 peptidylprolyl isomerase [Anabaena subtropica FACHB-260]